MSEIHESHPENIEAYVAVNHAAGPRAGEELDLYKVTVSLECDDNVLNRDYQIQSAKSLLAQHLRAFRLKGKEDHHEIGPVPRELVDPLCDLMRRLCTEYRWPCKVMGSKRDE